MPEWSTLLKLDRVDGPECPACGSNRAEELPGGTWWKVQSDGPTWPEGTAIRTAKRFRCGHCGRAFTVTEDNATEPEIDTRT